MLKREVIAHFEKPVHVARALNISRAAVAKWPDIIPKAAAYDLERLTGGALKFRPELYERGNRGAPIAAA
jgi:hypothetical protein